MADHDPVDQAPECAPPPPVAQPRAKPRFLPEARRVRAGDRMRRLMLPAVLLLSGCGFHLEGRVPLPKPIRRPYIHAVDQQSDFVQSLRRQMLISGAHPVESSEHATAVI